jgi:hypothetical protein
MPLIMYGELMFFPVIPVHLLGEPIALRKKILIQRALSPDIYVDLG